jgi:dihydropteroate synthase
MFANRQHFVVPLPGGRALELGPRTLVMGILNVTPDSFADGGLRFDPERAIADGRRMIDDGADIVDVGGESTRPGAAPVSAEDELRRVLPVVRGLAAQGRVPISIDTYKAVVAREAVAAGASIVNDISGLQYDLDLGRAMADTGAAVILMHTRGRSSQMYELAVYDDVVREVRAELQAAVDRAVAAGVRPESIIVDPGFGFAKRAEHSYAALAGLPEFAALGRPILSGSSRKSFLQLAIGERPPPGREWATAAAVTASVLLGAHIVRVHAVREMADVVRVADQVRGTGSLRHLSP